MKTMEIEAIEFGTAAEAVQYAGAAGHGRAIRCGGRYLVAVEGEIARIEAAGVAFSLLSEHPLPDGSFLILTVPVNG